MDIIAMRLPSLAVALLLAAGVSLTGCSSGASRTTSSVGSTAADAEAAAGAGAAGDGATSRRASAVGSDTSNEPTSGIEPAIIQTGTLTVRSDDVAGARFELEKVVDSYGGSITEERTTAGDEGRVRLSRVELRVPSAEFDAAMTGLAELGEVTESTRKAQDVTGEVIDTEARVRAQERSLERVEVLFARAQDIRDVIAIEAQLSRRQAELDSLKGRLAYLEDQTTLSMIAVYLEQTTTGEDPDSNAFVGGLRDGWDALAGLGAGLATLAGALLPFALVALLLGVPAAVAGRRLLARRSTQRPAVKA